MRGLFLFPLLLRFFPFCVWVFCLHNSVCAPLVCKAHGGQERAPGLLKLELQAFVSHPVGAGIQIRVLRRNSQCP